MGKQVLIVNYEPKSLSKLNQLMVEMGHDVETARNGNEALESVEQSVPDLIIMDPMLPKLSGFEVAQRLNADHPEIPIIMVTSVYKGNRYRTEAMTKYGVKEYLEEPFDDDVLKSHVSRFLKDDQPVAPKKHKKASTKRRLEEILEETLSGKIPGSSTTPKPKPEPVDEPVLTSSDIFGDVIEDVEKSEPEAAPVAGTEPVDEEVEKPPKEEAPEPKKAKDKKKEAKVEPKQTPEPEPAPQPQAEEKAEVEPEPAPEPVIEQQEAVIESKPPKSDRDDQEDKEPESLKGPDGEGIEYGSYVLLEKVATGGMADLFKAKRRGVQGFQKIVAIKRILSHLVDNEDFVTMFIDEAKLAAQLNHPNIAQIYDLGKIDNSFYIAMEYVEGYDLRNILKECNKEGIHIPEPLVLFIASKILSALDYAHRKKGLDMKDLQIVHRDISPQNILISKGGDVKLVDFGIAKAATKASQTQAGALKGKLLYMSPEQAYGKQIDNRSDLFSLGSVMYESLTGTKCFLADSEISILERVRNVQYTPLSDTEADVSEDTENLIAQALSKDIDVRYQSAKEMEADIHDLLEALPFAVSERILARFVNALYEGDKATIEEINNKYAVSRSAEPVAPAEPEPAPATETDPSATVRIDAAQEVASFTEEDLEPEAAPEASGKSDTGTMIMPDLEDVERAEDEIIEQYGDSGSGSKTGLWVALVIVCAIVGVVGWYMLKGRQVQSTPADSGTATTQTSTQQTPSETAAPTGENVAEGNEETQTPESDSDLPIQLNEEGTIPTDFDKEKLVEELMKQKLAEAERAQQAQARQSTPQPQRPVTQQPEETTTSQPEPATQEQTTTQTSQQPAVTEPEPAVTEPETTSQQPEETPAEQPDTTTQTTQSQEQPVEEASQESTTQEAGTPAAEQPGTAASETTQQPQTEPAQPAVDQPQLPQTKEGDLVPLVEGEVTFPEAIRQVTPTVTAMARKMRVHGTIVAQALIDENGDVIETRIIRNIPGRHGLDRSVMNALKEWKFKPAVKDGVKVKVYYTQAFTF